MCFQKWHEEFGKFLFTVWKIAISFYKVKIQKKQINQMQCEKFILTWKWMSSTISKTFYTCSPESLLLSYMKISKKTVKLGSFLQFSAHIFVGHNGCVWKSNVGTLWNHIMKNFQVKHDQCDSSIIFPQNIFLWSL